MSALIDELRSRPRPPAPAMARAIREAAGVSQQRLGAELGVSRVTVARWEAGTRSPSGKLAAAYLRILDELREVSA